MTKGQLELFNTQDFNLGNCKNVIKGRSKEGN